VVSGTGDAVFTVTAMIDVRHLTAGSPVSAWLVAVIPACSYAAIAAAGPFAGVLADRHDRRAVMAGTEIVRAAVMMLLAAAAFLPGGLIPASAWLVLLYAAVFTLSAGGQVFKPARSAMIATIFPGQDDRARATSLAQTGASAAALAGAALAIPLAAAGIGWPALLDAVSFAVSWLAVRSLPSCPGHGNRDFRREFGDGIRAFTGNRWLLALLAVTVTCQAGAAAFAALNVTLITVVLHGTSRTYAVATTLMGAGCIAGAALAVPLVRRLGCRRITCAGLAVAAVLTFMYASARSIPGALIFLACWEIAIAVLNTSVEPLLLAAVPRRVQGRVRSVFDPIGQLIAGGSVLAYGWLAASPLRQVGGRGPVPLLLVLGGSLIALSAVLAFLVLPHQSPEEEGEIPDDVPQPEPGTAT
jgi:MFS family permease